MATLPPSPPALEARAFAAPAAMRGRIAFASVQLGAFPSRAVAAQAGRSYGVQHAARISQPLRVQAAMVNGRQWFRLMAGPFPSTEAEGLCRDLSGQGLACMVRPEGQAAATTFVAPHAPHRHTITLARARFAPPRPLSSESYAGN
jgi:hypothetical protein